VRGQRSLHQIAELNGRKLIAFDIRHELAKIVATAQAARQTSLLPLYHAVRDNLQLHLSVAKITSCFESARFRE
jgi:hypothetical protein